MGFKMLLNRGSCIHAMNRNRPMLYRCNAFIKCVPLKASKIISTVKASPHQGTLKLPFINGSLRSTTLHIPWEVAGLVVGVRLFVIFQIKMSLGAPLKLLTCFKCPLLMLCPWSEEFKGCSARTLRVPRSPLAPGPHAE